MDTTHKVTMRFSGIKDPFHEHITEPPVILKIISFFFSSNTSNNSQIHCSHKPF